jgi:hypothetical protein
MIEFLLLFACELHLSCMKYNLINAARELVRSCVLVINRCGVVGADVETLEPHQGTTNRAGDWLRGAEKRNARVRPQQWTPAIASLPVSLSGEAL